MRTVLLVVLLAAVGCGQAAPSPVGSPLTQPQLKFAVIDAAGRPVYCDPDFYPLARAGGEEENAINFYPQIRSDTQTYAAIVAHEHLPSGDLTDQQKLTVYRAWKLLRVVVLTPSGSDFSFQYRTQSSSGSYQMVSGTVRVDGAVSVSSRTPSTPPACPICLAASTSIATPAGPVPVTEIQVGAVVWSQAADGSRTAEPVVEVGSMEAPAGHMVVDLALADGRELMVSPGHRTADGRPVGTLKVGDPLSGSVITRWHLVLYAGERTYDLLPAGPTGYYWADGILMSSTLAGADERAASGVALRPV
ncbi:MAG TPA: hypothetical protein VNA65_03925 [Candidatus Dormibacteraeota bacterium]|nr:hypothetical protein [Candidatus Dormibacteraeota bacterium]